ncbi:MAG: hypothetical protein KGL11_10395 [Alphaproteobacteria bacterium]|nr:hypothetical protein [Alphaproteobacteria bacterium]
MSRPKSRPPRVEALAPTPERWAKGDLAPLPRAIADEHGRPSRPYRAEDTLARMQRLGTISAEMRQAGDDFHALFALAHLDPLGAPDLRRVRQGVREQHVSARAEDARRKVWTALKALGGPASPSGSCVWHVVGCGWTLKEWSLRAGWSGRALTPETASGILIGALGVLQALYGL